ncbi:adenylate kinase family protein [Halorussus amylolyticus]|uniref:adenylate kinase family protein n=1 Tax=Halorussus amylolyticus TaxID=1126242 RepID=UPI00138EF82D|nr:adenylate kinase family protein [Halorussus amylolyticus]
MRVAVTGTPGTGKTTAIEALVGDERLDRDFEVVHLNDLIRDEDLWNERDEDRDSLVADLEAVRERLADRGDLLVESHLAHHLDADRVVVLRCHPEELERRLSERGESEAKARENAESEALDVILSEAVSEHGVERVYEIDTTDRSPDAVAADISAVLAGEREPSAGDVDFLDYL